MFACFPAKFSETLSVRARIIFFFLNVPGDRIELLVSSENAAGRGLYRKLGFTEATTQYQDWAAEDEIGMTVRTTALPSSSRPAGVGVEVHECTRVGKHRCPVAQAAD